MNPQHACCSILSQLKSLVEQIQDQDFTRPAQTLSQSTVGQHLRHTLEFFVCLESGLKNGVVNYDKRAHDKQIETNRNESIQCINRIISFIESVSEDKPINLEVGYDQLSDQSVTIASNYMRELVYNIEHAVHHMAIMKIGIREVAPYITLPTDFGVAVSTIRFKEAASVQQ